MKLKHLARLITTAVPEERPAIALESVGSGTMRLLTEDLPVRSGLESGVASVEPGDVLFGKLRPYLAKTWRAEFAAHASTELLCLRPAVETVDSRWFAYLAASQPLVDWATSLSDGAKMPRTSWERLRSMEVDVPRLETQRSIVDFLDAETSRIDDLLRLRQGHLALLGERQRSEISALVSEGEEVPLRRVIALRTSGPRGWAELVGEKGAPFVRSANLRRDTIELGLEDVARIQAPAAPEANRSRIARGDVLIGITGANTGWVGLVGEEVDGGYISQHVALLRPLGVDPSWLAYSVFSTQGQQQLLAGQYGGTKQQLGLDDLAELRIRLPRRELQSELVRRLNRSRALTQTAERLLARQIELLRERKQALITAGVMGRLDLARDIAEEAS